MIRWETPELKLTSALPEKQLSTGQVGLIISLIFWEDAQHELSSPAVFEGLSSRQCDL